MTYNGGDVQFDVERNTSESADHLKAIRYQLAWIITLLVIIGIPLVAFCMAFLVELAK